MKNRCFVYNRKHFITKKPSYTEGALSAVFPRLFFIEITRLVLPLNGKKLNIHERTITMDYIHWEGRITCVASEGQHCLVF